MELYEKGWEIAAADAIPIAERRSSHVIELSEDITVNFIPEQISVLVRMVLDHFM
jgi:hypothetical protein